MQSTPSVVGDDFVQKRIGGTTVGADSIPFLNFKRMILKRQTLDRGVGRHGINAFLAARAKQLQRRVHVHLGVVKLGDRRRRHDVAVVHDHRVVIGGGNVAVARNVLIQLHMHQAVLGQAMQCAGLGFTRLQALHGFRHRHLVDQNLPLGQGHFRNAVTRLNQRGLMGARGGIDARRAFKKAPNIDGVDRVIGALVDHFERVVGPNDRCSDLDASSTPAIRQWHFSGAKRHLATRNGHRFQNGAADHALGALVKIRKVNFRRGHAFSWRVEAMALAGSAGLLNFARILRTSSSSD